MASPLQQIRFRVRVRKEIVRLLRVHPGNRPWQLPLAAALAMGIPLLTGCFYQRLDLGLVGSLAGLVFLYVPNAPLVPRMRRLAACSIGMILCHAAGLLCHQMPVLLVPMIMLVTACAVMLCRRFSVGPPGSLFFVMAAAIGAYSPIPMGNIPAVVGIFSLSSLLACVIGLIYSLALPEPAAASPPKKQPFRSIAFAALVIGVFTGLSLLAAQALHLQKAYWVPVSCVVVIQGTSLRAVWTRKVHRVAGTTLGLALAWTFLTIPFDPWRVSLMVMALAFIVEIIVVRHYALAVIFITPLAILLAEAASLGHGSVTSLIWARFINTLIGCVFGFAGGLVLHFSERRRLRRRSGQASPSLTE